MPENTADLDLAKRIVDFLNELHLLDAEALTALVDARVPCNAAICDHPSCQVTDDDRVGLLGVLNGLCGTFADSSGPIASIYVGPGNAGPIVGFAVRQDPEGRPVSDRKGQATAKPLPGRDYAARQSRVLPATSLDFGESSEGTSYIEGWASCYHNIDEYGTLFAPTAFDDVIGEFTRKGIVAGLNHDWGEPIGAVVDARSDTARGLYCRGELLPKGMSAEADRLRPMLTYKFSTGRTMLRSLSIGFDVTAYRRMTKLDELMSHWRSVGYAPTPEDRRKAEYWTTPRDYGGMTWTPGVDVIDAAYLYEFSPVCFPGNRGAEITDVRGQGRGAAPRVEPEPKRRRLNLRALVALASLDT